MSQEISIYMYNAGYLPISAWFSKCFVLTMTYTYYCRPYNIMKYLQYYLEFWWPFQYIDLAMFILMITWQWNKLYHCLLLKMSDMIDKRHSQSYLAYGIRHKFDLMFSFGFVSHFSLWQQIYNDIDQFCYEEWQPEVAMRKWSALGDWDISMAFYIRQNAGMTSLVRYIAPWL